MYSPEVRERTVQSPGRTMSLCRSAREDPLACPAVSSYYAPPNSACLAGGNWRVPVLLGVRSRSEVDGIIVTAAVGLAVAGIVLSSAWGWLRRVLAG